MQDPQFGMRILIFTQHFPPETAATGRRAFDLAESLAQLGHKVTVLTGVPNHPSSLARPFCQRAPRREIAAAGYSIVRVSVFRSEDTRALNRLLTYATFALSAAWAGLRQARPDVILAVSPLPAGLAALPVHWLRGAPLAFDLQDIWPDSAVSVGVMQPCLALRLLRRLERFFYRRCVLIVGITEGFRRYLIQLGIEPEHVAVIPNGVDLEMFSGVTACSELRKSHEAEGEFVVGYAGNIGRAQDLSTLLDAADALRASPVKFILLGEGTDKARIQKLARIQDLEYVEFLDGVPRKQVAPVLASCDALLLILRSDPLFEITIPSKVYEYMAAGKPILCSVGGEASGLVSQARCGISIEPSDGAALARAVETLRENPGLCKEMGRRGKHCARERFSRLRLMADYGESIASLASQDRKTTFPFRLPALKHPAWRKP
jgi:glycosyltransferase involved in cell wall biosynthesis